MWGLCNYYVLNVSKDIKYYMLFYRNPLDMDDFDDDDTEELAEEKDKDVKIPNKYNLQAGPV